MVKNFALLIKAIVAVDRKRLGVISASLIGACTIPVTAANAAGCEPGPKEVTFFKHEFYKGACSVLGVGDYPDAKAMRIKNDSISSIKIGSRVTVKVCKNAAKGNVNSSQKCQVLEKSETMLKYKRIGNDSISSATIIPIFGGYTGTTNGACKPSPGQEAIAVYQHPNYKGSCTLLTIGRYNNSKEMRIKNDSISSIEFGSAPNIEINVREHSNLRGRISIFDKSISNLKHSEIGDNAISSIIVFRKK